MLAGRYVTSRSSCEAAARRNGHLLGHVDRRHGCTAASPTLPRPPEAVSSYGIAERCIACDNAHHIDLSDAGPLNLDLR